MDFMKDPNDRRRIDAEAQRERDAEVARMRRANVPFRVIAARLGTSLGAIQKSVRRSQKLAAAVAADVDAVLDDGLTCEDVQTPEDVELLNPLERWRLRHEPGEFGDAERVRVRVEREAERRQFAAEHADAIARGRLCAGVGRTPQDPRQRRAVLA